MMPTQYQKQVFLYINKNILIREFFIPMLKLVKVFNAPLRWVSLLQCPKDPILKWPGAHFFQPTFQRFLHEAAVSP